MRLCTICSHPDRHSIEKDILSGQSHNSLSIKYGVGSTSINYHKQNHLPERMLKAYQKKEVMNDFNMMKEFTTLIADIKDQIERLKAKKSEGLTIAATNTLIKLYSVMCQFASVFYNNQDGNIQEKIEEQAQQEEEELQNRISILTFEELKLFQALVYKIEIQDEGIDVISNINNKSAAVMYELLDVVPNIVPEAKIQTKPRLKRTILPNNELSDLRVREI